MLCAVLVLSSISSPLFFFGLCPGCFIQSEQKEILIKIEPCHFISKEGLFVESSRFASALPHVGRGTKILQIAP